MRAPRLQRYVDPGAAAALGPVLGAHAAAVERHQSAADVEPQPLCGRGTRSRPREQGGELGSGHRRPPVLDGAHHAALLCLQGDDHLVAFRAAPDGSLHQAAEGLAQSLAIEARLHRAFGALEPEAHVPSLGLFAVCLDEPLPKEPHVECLRL